MRTCDFKLPVLVNSSISEKFYKTLLVLKHKYLKQSFPYVKNAEIEIHEQKIDLSSLFTIQGKNIPEFFSSEIVGFIRETVRFKLWEKENEN
jgi:hypothetical protein